MKKKITVSLLLVLLCITFAFAGALGRVYVQKSKCVSCQDCVKTCPVNAVSIVQNKAVIDTEKCINCNLCVKACTYQAIKVAK
ncbi:MAG: 4Fe-4S binding protein [Candidatus Cloacimonetes bacterium]|mgnify:FL=1|jgi:Fe-S-cluster-containing hydrogenase component 2|nr:4Fe-4S binding protein [Candidatus Cloacimonadota bacterium]